MVFELHCTVGLPVEDINKKIKHVLLAAAQHRKLNIVRIGSEKAFLGSLGHRKPNRDQIDTEGGLYFIS